MNDLKLSVKIMLPGGMMVTQDESRHLEKTNLEEEINTPKMKVVDKMVTSDGYIIVLNGVNLPCNVST